MSLGASVITSGEQQGSCTEDRCWEEPQAWLKICSEEKDEGRSRADGSRARISPSSLHVHAADGVPTSLQVDALKGVGFLPVMKRGKPFPVYRITLLGKVLPRLGNALHALIWIQALQRTLLTWWNTRWYFGTQWIPKSCAGHPFSSKPLGQGQAHPLRNMSISWKKKSLWRIFSGCEIFHHQHCGLLLHPHLGKCHVYTVSTSLGLPVCTESTGWGREVSPARSVLAGRRGYSSLWSLCWLGFIARWRTELGDESGNATWLFCSARAEAADCGSEEGSCWAGYAKKNSHRLGGDLAQGQRVPHEYSCAFG